MRTSQNSFGYSVHVNPPVLTLRLHGDLDMATAHSLAWPEAMQLHLIRRVFIDLAHLTFCDVAGIRALDALCACAAQHGRAVHVAHARPVVQRVAEITGIAARWLDQPDPRTQVTLETPGDPGTG